MSHEKTSTAQDFFMNLGVVATLYTVVISFLTLAFSVVNRLFPDSLTTYYSDPYSSGVRFAMASIIIVFPLFAWLSRTVIKANLKDEHRKHSPIRRWMVYVTLFLAAATLVVDLIVILNSFLAGDLTVRFILKAITVLVAAGLVFWHYLGEIRDTNTYKKYITVIVVATVLVVAGLVSAFITFGSPSTVRALRFDDRRVSDLQSIQWQLVSFYQGKGEVPQSLDTLNDPISSWSTPHDPETGDAYAYQKTGTRSFQLCADFNQPSSQASMRSYAYPTSASADFDNWKHGTGTVCFDRTIDPDFYPVREKGMTVTSF